MKVSVVLGTHENSDVFNDTLESVRHYWTDDVLVVVDGLSWSQFDNCDFMRIQGFNHGKESAPVRNVALGLMKAWEMWGDTPDWYCYMEYDCLVGSKLCLEQYKEMGFWILGNDRRSIPERLPFLEVFSKSQLDVHYLLGCCVFFSSEFMRALDADNFFERFLNFTNFFTQTITLKSAAGKQLMVYDLSEYMYPTLAAHYGGKVGELAAWEGVQWRGCSDLYPMRYKPEISEEDPFRAACMLHPLKSFDSPVRTFHREKRGKN
jgi:hypothetical protein